MIDEGKQWMDLRTAAFREIDHHSPSLKYEEYKDSYRALERSTLQKD